MVVDLFDTLDMIEGWYKSSMKYRSHKVRHVAEDEYDTWPNHVTSVKV
jgi:hypothetical protein